MKVSKKEFLHILKANSGLFAQTAKDIEEKFNVTYSRQAARERAEKYPIELNEILEDKLDRAEAGLFNLMLSKSEPIKIRAIEFYLKTKGKKRGYIEKSEMDVTTQGVQLVINCQSEADKKLIENL